jgi:type IV fimbrial biogenesis protein FimT
MCKRKGFSLIELLVVISVFAILASITLPAFDDWLQAQKAQQVIKQLYSVINYTRTEAIKRGRTVIMCPTADQQTCSRSRDWSMGYMVVVADNDKISPVSSDILRIYPPLSGHLQWDSFPQGVFYLSFFPINMNTASIHNGTFKYCIPRAGSRTKAVTLIFIKTGRARFATPSDKVHYC